VNGVYWVYSDASEPLAPPRLPPAKRAPMPLAIVLCPRGGQDLYGEMRRVRAAGVDTLISMLSHEQVAMLDLDEEPALAASMGMEFLHHPLPDHKLPPDEHAFRAFVSELAERLRSGERIGIHCWGSIGRAPLTAACTLIHLGWKPAEAIAAIAEARGCPVPDTEEQERWILSYQAKP
jgi:protein-tyrosine phosphatase